jgi:Zn finger protein HypA/HybF involved in hydrogenase expression
MWSKTIIHNGGRKMNDNFSNEPNEIDGEARTAECEVCGGHMVFDPKTQGMKCPFCGGIQDIDKTRDNIIELDISKMNQMDFNWNIEKKVIICQNCGGETIVEPNDETQYCSFCGSQHILKREDNDMGMKPQGILPYQLTNDGAKEQLKKWIKRRYLAPRDLGKRYLDRNLKGIYIPFWTFDADTFTTYNCQIGTYYYTGSGKERKRHVRWRPHHGKYSRFFDDTLVCAISHEHHKYIKKIEPFNMGAVVDYSPDFMAGYYAQKYTIMPDVAYKMAQENMGTDIKHDVVSSLPGDTYRSYSQRVSFSDVTFKHLLLPVYMMSYVYKEKMYNVMVNGQTGEVQGQSPVSAIKVILLVILACIVIYLFYRYYGN